MTRPEPNVVERLGLEFLRGRIARAAPDIHEWTDAERAEIQRIERRTTMLAAVAGAASGGVLAAVEIGLRGWMGADPDAGAWRQTLPYWSTYFGLAALVSGLELLYLYWTILRSVARIGSIAGLSLSARDIDEVIALGLSRAALDLPNPREPVYGIDPYVRVPRWKLAAYSVVYRLKVGATSFVLRVLLRRIASRAALRFVIPIAAIPVFTAWNGVIAIWIMREARIRAAGPIAVQQLGGRITDARAQLDEESRQVAVASAAEVIIRAQDAHPNFVLLLSRVFQELDVSPDSLRADWDSSRARLRTLPHDAQEFVLTTVTAMAILAGGRMKRQKAFLEDIHAVCNRSFDARALRRLYQAFRNGEGLSEEHLKAVSAPGSHDADPAPARAGRRHPQRLKGE